MKERWTKDQFIAAAKAFARVFGYFPSTSKWQDVRLHFSVNYRRGFGTNADSVWPPSSDITKHWGSWKNFHDEVLTSFVEPDEDITDLLMRHGMRGNHTVNKVGQIQHHPMWIEDDTTEVHSTPQPPRVKDVPIDRSRYGDTPPRAIPPDNGEVTLETLRRAIWRTHYTNEETLKRECAHLGAALSEISERIVGIERAANATARRLQAIEERLSSRSTFLGRADRDPFDEVYWGVAFSRKMMMNPTRNPFLAKR